MTTIQGAGSGERSQTVLTETPLCNVVDRSLLPAPRSL